jgi:hypothetical protein
VNINEVQYRNLERGRTLDPVVVALAWLEERALGRQKRAFIAGSEDRPKRSHLGALATSLSLKAACQALAGWLVEL